MSEDVVFQAVHMLEEVVLYKFNINSKIKKFYKVKFGSIELLLSNHINSSRH